MARASERVEVSVPLDTAYLTVIRQVASRFARRHGFVGDEIDKVEMAIDEACANAMLHQPSCPDSFVDVCLESHAGSMTITLADRGCEFAFHELGHLDLEEHNEGDDAGGLGVFIIREFMDEVRYEHGPGVGNLLTLVKYRASAATLAGR